MSDRIRIEHYGYHERPDQTEASYDPGTTAPCLFCFEPWTMDTVRTISLAPLTAEGRIDGVAGSYFYRVHRACHERFMAERPGEEEPPSAWLMAVIT